MSHLVLKLYVAGRSPRSQRAVSYLEALCARELAGEAELQVIDVLRHPELAEEARIFATPTLVKESPAPQRRLVGDLSETKVVLEWLAAPSGQNRTPREET